MLDYLEATYPPRAPATTGAGRTRFCHANRATANSACGPVRGVALWRANAREFGGGRPINRSKRLIAVAEFIDR